MRKWFLLLVLAASALSARAAERVTVEQLEQFLAAQQAVHTTDEATAQKLGAVELSERLTELKLERLKAEFHPGEKTAMALDVLADLSAFLEPPAGKLPDKAAPGAEAQHEMIAAAMNFATVTLKHLPNFLATRTTESFEDVPVLTPDSSFQSGMHAVGTGVREVAYRNGREFASDEPTAAGAENAHAAPAALASAGEFGPVLETVMTDSAHGKIGWSGWEQSATGVDAVFHYEVPKQAAHYQIEFCCIRNPVTGSLDTYRGKPGYHGSITVDPSSGAVLRLTLEADFDGLDDPPNFGLLVVYGEVEISGGSLMCPLKSAVVLRGKVLARKREWDVVHVNDVGFSDYRRFGSTARMVTGQAGR